MTGIITRLSLGVKSKFKTDGCSTGLLSWLPYFRYYNKKFYPACAGHDWLYENAHSLGMDKLECDIEFLLMMLDIAENKRDKKAAYRYYLAVKHLGHTYFKRS